MRMAEEVILFYDTYAILEIIKGNANYKNYLKNIILWKDWQMQNTMMFLK